MTCAQNDRLSPARPASSPLPAGEGKGEGERQRSLGGNVSTETSKPSSLSPALSRWERGPTRPPSSFPAAIRHDQHSSRRHGRLPPDLPSGGSARGWASPDVWDGYPVGGLALSDIQRCSAELGTALPDIPEAIRHFTDGFPSLRRPVRHFGDAVLRLFDHFPQLSVSVG